MNEMNVDSVVGDCREAIAAVKHPQTRSKFIVCIAWAFTALWCSCTNERQFHLLQVIASALLAIEEAIKMIYPNQ